MIAFYGIGLLGSNFVRALRRRGEEVHVWNRTAAKARVLEADGARAFDNPADAARGAARVHLTLSDDAAVDAVLEQAREGFDNDAIIVDHTTTSPTPTAARIARWNSGATRFQHAPVFMGPANALNGTGMMLASGDRALYDMLAPELKKMTGDVQYLGPVPERAAAMKLIGNLLLMAVTSGLVDALALAKSLDVSAHDLTALMEWFNPGASMPARLKRILHADFAHPSWELIMARKDTRLMLEEAARGGAELPSIAALAHELDRWIEDGHGHDDWMVFASHVVR